jgi:uncharacterized protein (TIGR00290 family)
MKVIALVSGGKDSIYAIHLAVVEQHHELIACIHLAAVSPVSTSTTTKPKKNYNNRDEAEEVDNEIEEEEEEVEESYMYQSAGSNVVSYQIEQCLQVPCIVVPRTGRSLQTGMFYTTSNTNAGGTSTSSTNTTSEEYDHRSAETCTNVSQQVRVQQQETQQQHDEVEDLHVALQIAKERYPMIEGVCNGAILSHYQRNRIEYIVCHHMQLHSLSYCWRKTNPSQLLQDMIHTAGIKAILIKTACPPTLLPHKHLQQHITQLTSLQQTSKYTFQLCGEGGEYETLVLNAHIFPTKHLVIDRSTILYDPNDSSIGTLLIHDYHTELKPKQNNNDDVSVQSKGPAPISSTLSSQNTTENNTQDSCAQSNVTLTTTISTNASQNQHCRRCHHPMIRMNNKHLVLQQQQQPLQHTRPHVRQVNGGLYSISEIMSPQPIHSNDDDTTRTTTTTITQIQTEMREILTTLQSTLDSIHCTAQDIVMVHVYLSNMSYFTILNDDYRTFFQTVLPPSRSTIDIGTIHVSASPSSTDTHQTQYTCNIIIDCSVQCGSGTYMRHDPSINKHPTDMNGNAAVEDTVNTKYAQAALQNTFVKVRDVLHVQSRSYWAPVCVGPYSQVNTVRGCIHFCAGQIGLYPPTMQFQYPISWTHQLHQTWINVANVLDALDACCIHKNMLFGILFMSDSVFQFQDQEWTKLCALCTTQMLCNGNVIPGDIDGIILDPKNNMNDDDEYEDEETRIENEKNRIPTTVDDSVNSIDSQLLCPILVVSIPQMPVGALCEIEVVAASRRATNALHISDYTHTTKNSSILSNHDLSKPTATVLPMGSSSERFTMGWDTGHEYFTKDENVMETIPDTDSEFVSENDSNTIAASLQTSDTTTDEIQIRSYFRCLGSHATACALVTASICCDDDIIELDPATAVDVVDPYSVLRSMIQAMTAESHYDHDNILHLRLYYIKATTERYNVRQALQSILQYSFRSTGVIPATTIIPVTDMDVIQPHPLNNIASRSIRSTHPFFAIQAISMDPIRTEQSLWIHEGRDK